MKPNDKAQEITRMQAERIGWYRPQRQKKRDAVLKPRASLAEAAAKERDALLARLAPEDDEALVEIAAHCEAIFDGWTFSSLERLSQDVYRVRAHQLLASIRPHIEAAERERCAKAVITVAKKINVAHHERPEWEDGYLQGVHDAAAAIRSGK